MTDDPMFRAGVEADLPDRFEAWWANYRHTNRDEVGYFIKKQIAFDAYEAATRALPPPSPHTDEGQADSAHHAIPVGMKPWAGGKDAPEDWDGGSIAFRSGEIETDDPGPWYWKHDNESSDIIAYTPVSDHPVAGDDEARARERHALCLLIERMCPDKPESNLGHPIGSQVEALADAMLAFARTRPSAANEVEARGIQWVIGEARKSLRLVEGCLECNADDERRWRETIEWLERLA